MVEIRWKYGLAAEIFVTEVFTFIEKTAIYLDVIDRPLSIKNYGDGRPETAAGRRKIEDGRQRPETEDRRIVTDQLFTFSF